MKIKNDPFGGQIKALFGDLKTPPTIPPKKTSEVNAFVKKHFDKKRSFGKKNDK